MNASRDFPNFTETNHRETSPATPSCNCIAWSAEDNLHWWQPGKFWLPANWPADDFGIGALEALFRALGYVDCGSDASLEPGFLKVALYGSGWLYTHAARQMPDGYWTSKLGKGMDIQHDDPSVVADGVYGNLVQVMKRAANSV